MPPPCNHIGYKTHGYASIKQYHIEYTTNGSRAAEELFPYHDEGVGGGPSVPPAAARRKYNPLAGQTLRRADDEEFQ